MGVPPIRVLLPIFISEDRLKRSSMQVEIEYLRGKKRRGGKRADKQLVDYAIPLDADGGEEDMAGWVATTRRTSGPAGVKGTAGQS